MLRLNAYWFAFIATIFLCSNIYAQDSGFKEVANLTQPKLVKITGSGGFSGLEAYQSGFLISQSGHILTVWSYVLDTDDVGITLNDGQAFEAKLVGYDPRIEIAVLKIEASGLSAFNLDAAVSAQPGSKVLAFSNLYQVATGNEPTSVLQGVISAKTRLSARRGASESPYDGQVYVLDAMTNNPGAAGGAVVDRQGQLIGMIGKELRDARTNSWLNFAIPIEELVESVAEIRDGKKVVATNAANQLPAEPISLELLGISLVPDVVAKTPPFIDGILENSVAQKTGLLPDDLIIEIDGQMTPSHRNVQAKLRQIDRDKMIIITIQRNRKFKTFQLKLGD